MKAHQFTAEQLADRKLDLVTAEVKLTKVEADMTQVKTDLHAANKMIEGHSLVVTNKDIKINKLREQLEESTGRERNAVAEYRKSMDFVARLANRYNSGWAVP